METVDERVTEEVEALEAILMDDVSIKSAPNGIPYAVEAVVFPATADDTDQQYVRVTLEVKLTPGYPDNAPEVFLRNPRGLDDDQLRIIMEQIEEKCNNCCGDPVIYDLIELVREHLTSSNLPACPCTICLYGFSEGDHFIKTSCYHYYHAHCLAQHASKTEKFFNEEQEKLPHFQRSKTFEVLCPICREPIKCDVETLSKASLPLAVQNASIMEPDEKLREMQDYMSALYIQQKEKGGIIDPDAADNKVLLVNEPATPEEEPETPRWRQRQIEQQERQRQRALQQRDGHGHGHGRPPQQPRLPKPPPPTKPEEDGDEDGVDGNGTQRSIGRQRRGRGRGARLNHRNR
ncbi:E3 ubiquitin-protein ligase RNF25 isoform X2 [Thrips palmi]|uniref:E3 ubiquitin-protein ligase RNF25 isoform X2 n=1 Tax=Thrips palmi TaxID=161013 RepID=A0A6P8YVA3_THRPL|nr:E3 ubiquitin-protein ligase RNF25 isoform X2 [Thrips palmi]